jgi:hypothetical protein
VDDCSDVANRKPVVGEASGQCHAVQLFGHAGKGYAVMKRGASVVSQSRLNISVNSERWLDTDSGRPLVRALSGGRALSRGTREPLGRLTRGVSWRISLANA